MACNLAARLTRPTVHQIARAEDVAHLRPFNRRRRRITPWWLVGAVSGLAVVGALVILGCAR
jgi:hypothetical protein